LRQQQRDKFVPRELVERRAIHQLLGIDSPKSGQPKSQEGRCCRTRSGCFWLHTCEGHERASPINRIIYRKLFGGRVSLCLVSKHPTLDIFCIKKSHQINAGMMIVCVTRESAAVAARPMRVR
jgi:hypothetical protein